MQIHDSLQRFVFEKTDIRGELVHLQETHRHAMRQTDYPPALKRLLGEAMSAAALLSATIKFSGKLSLQLQGDGIVSLLLVQATDQQEIRGMIRWEGDTNEKSFGELTGNAQFAITIEPADGQRYQGIVPLDGRNLSQCLEGYFLQSEQIPTRIWLSADEDHAAGLLMQRLPGTAQEKSDQDWEHVTILAETITDDELLNLPNETFLYRLFHGETVRLYDPQAVVFSCVCSKDRCEQAIISLGASEIQQLLDEQKGVTMNCEFCGATHQLDVVDIARLLKLVTDSISDSSPSNVH